MSSAVDSLLVRLKIPDLIPKFREMNVDRIISLRKLSEEELRTAVPDDDQRNRIIEAIKNRGSSEKRTQAPAASINPPRSTDDGGRGGMSYPRGAPRGGGPVRGRGRGGTGSAGEGGFHGSGSNNANMFPSRQRVCNHFLNGDCRYGDSCRYSHNKALCQEAAESVPRRNHDATSLSEDFSETCIIPTHRIKYLLANRADRLRSIHSKNRTHNKSFQHIDPTIEKFELVIYGADQQSVQESKKMILACIGVTREEEQKNRVQYTMNELSSNQRAAKFLAACNMKNEGTVRELSEASLRNIISFFRFEKQQDIRHFWVNTNSEHSKLDIIANIVAQLQGVQAIMFCDQKRVVDMSKVASKITRYFNGVSPLFLHRAIPKEERMKMLQTFKDGKPNENGIRERLLVTNEDYAKLARKTIVPYVNLVINYSVPRSEEYYLLQSLVAGRSDTVGVSIVCVFPHEQSLFQELQRNIPFEELEEEGNFKDAAVKLVYDTVDEPLTGEDADPPSNWHEQLKPKTL
ncbi:zinc finger protein family member, putative [Trypanosoma equiperdum]|uniref:C3H1-type domain-containing protein n=4 Tax=Trypanozoon TaxID=39700 RepID=Q386W1_TRYB2|nr:hypothetical protein, conserved [Trypanosoma brucei gambiense DAL972]XP_828282.1 hypothetical protein, conserved [Trypanosoma brucei brucei TREU927]RHW68473.1 zinc finger protein family member [Trypanosoma brucei equiperdum]SCU72145.1 zinc finger protein family member, putative [Trypanosoma equiperdum]EAN79170.1 hypothetical protein, conserved [Trypanosoma brucei brucei TREU927]CBH17098.1 hypothetical protein, conserved [Trypanosoma brucei gambiense DAL972]|eukprot:XP_011779362.1 hypothetical protein, conserved [Trypanosoma brucei gambiense DAL972]